MSGRIEAPALSLEGVEVRFGARTALHGLDLEVRPGEFVALAGPNGSGKTTLLRVALGLLEPASGSARLFGAPVAALPVVERARRAAWVPQSEDPRDDVALTDYVLYGRYAHHGALDGESAEDRRVLAEVLALVGLADRASEGILTLSGGERQRAILARALAQRARVLLLDEPTSHLDIAHQLDLLERVQRLAKTERLAVVAALHDLNLAARFADRIVVLSRGRLVADGPPSTVLSEELLLRVWGIAADLRTEPRTGQPYLIPHRLPAPPPPGARSPTEVGPIHVIGGGGSAAPLLRALVDEGFRVTAGVLHLLDSDAEAAEALGVPAALEAPFAPISPESRARLRALLASARGVVVAPVPFGPSNLANLEELLALDPRPPIWLMAAGPDSGRDFAEGRASALLGRLRSSGATEVADAAALLAAVRTASGPALRPRDGGDGQARPAGEVELPK